MKKIIILLVVLGLVGGILFYFGVFDKETEITTKELVKERLEIEKELRNLALSQPYIVSIKTMDAENISLQTGFAVDRRGYILTAAHGNFRFAKEITIIFQDGKYMPARFVDEIQTLDAVLLAVDKPFDFSAPPFADFLQIAMEQKYSFDKNSYMMDEKDPNRFLVLRCTNKDGSLKLERILIGEFFEWNKAKGRLEVQQLQQDAYGCSGAPFINKNGEIMGMIRTVTGNIISGFDAPTLDESVKLLIKEDIKKQS